METHRALGRTPELISVIVPALDEEEHIAAQLRALAAQTYRGRWELVVVDNRCTDRTVEIVKGLRDGVPSLTIADARDRPGLNHARNVGAREARGDFLAFCDADDVASPGWLEAMAQAARGSELVAGALDYEALNPPQARALYPWDPPTALDGDGFLPYAPGGNCGVWTAVALEVGWDEAFRFGSSDMEFSWRVQLADHRLAFAPDAVIHQRLDGRLGSFARRYYAYGRSDPQLFRRFRDLGMARPEALTTPSRLARRAPDLLGSDRTARANWIRHAAHMCGRLVGSAQNRVLVR